MHFRVAVEEMMPGIMLNETNDTLTAKGPLIDLLLLLAERLNFTYSLKRPLDNAWGTLTENGYTGMIGMIIRNEADFAISPFTLTYERWSAVKTSVPVFVDHVEILLPSREFQISLFTVLTIYKWDVWISLLLSILIISLITTASNEYYRTQISLHQTILNYLWQAYRNFLLQGYKQRGHQSSVIRSLSILLILLTLVMSFVFSSSLLMTLVVRKVQPIDSLEDLAGTDICPIFEKQSSTYAKFKNSKLDTVVKIFQRANADPNRNIIRVNSMEKEGMDLVDAGTHAILLDGAIVRSILSNKIKKGRSCSYRLAKNPALTMWKVLVFGQAFPKDLLHKINSIIQHSSESGFISARIEEKYDGYTYCLEQTAGKVNSISLDHVKGIFLIWGLGCAIGFIVLCGEFYYSGKCINSN